MHIFRVRLLIKYLEKGSKVILFYLVAIKKFDKFRSNIEILKAIKNIREHLSWTRIDKSTTTKNSTKHNYKVYRKRVDVSQFLYPDNKLPFLLKVGEINNK